MLHFNFKFQDICVGLYFGFVIYEHRLDLRCLRRKAGTLKSSEIDI